MATLNQIRSFPGVKEVSPSDDLEIYYIRCQELTWKLFKLVTDFAALDKVWVHLSPELRNYDLIMLQAVQELSIIKVIKFNGDCSNVPDLTFEFYNGKITTSCDFWDTPELIRTALGNSHIKSLILDYEETYPVNQPLIPFYGYQRPDTPVTIITKFSCGDCPVFREGFENLVLVEFDQPLFTDRVIFSYTELDRLDNLPIKSAIFYFKELEDCSQIAKFLAKSKLDSVKVYAPPDQLIKAEQYFKVTASTEPIPEMPEIYIKDIRDRVYLNTSIIIN